MNPRGPTNFGDYDDFGRQTATSSWRWRLRVALRIALLAAAVVLAGLFMLGSSVTMNTQSRSR